MGRFAEKLDTDMFQFHIDKLNAVVEHGIIFNSCVVTTALFGDNLKGIHLMRFVYIGAQVQDFLMHFWQGMPSHLEPILGSCPLVDIVAVCDIITYQVMQQILLYCGREVLIWTGFLVSHF